MLRYVLNAIATIPNKNIFEEDYRFNAYLKYYYAMFLEQKLSKSCLSQTNYIVPCRILNEKKKNSWCI